MRAPTRFFWFLRQKEDKRKKLNATMIYVAFISSDLADGLKSTKASTGPVPMAEAVVTGLTLECEWCLCLQGSFVLKASIIN